MGDSNEYRYFNRDGSPRNGWQGVDGLDQSKLGWTPETSSRKDLQTYSGEGGNFSRLMQGGQGIGGWSDSSGRMINDLGGYLKKGSLQKTGSDFSQEQNQLTGLLNDPSKIQQTAGYQFDVDQGNQAINRSAAAKGSLNSGGVLAELAKYGQGMASKEYGDQVNRLSGIIGQKQNFGVGSGYYNDLNTSQLPKR